MTYDNDSNQHMMPDEESHGRNKHDDDAVQLMMNDDESYEASCLLKKTFPV